MSEPILEIRNLTKDFSGIQVLKGINLQFLRGEVHGLLGENGAGKSTLIKILTGVYGATSGEILLEGKPTRIASPLDAHRQGLGAVYQDAELIGGFTVAENILFGNEPGSALINRRQIEAEARRICGEAGIDIDVERKASSLSAAEMQLVTLGTLFHRAYKVIILDEPTARLSVREVELLFRTIKIFLKQGITIIYISHRLEEVKRMCDRVTVLRGGFISATLDKSMITEDRITELMVDRSRHDFKPRPTAAASDRIAIELDQLQTAKLKPLSLAVRKGEVLGITGPVGGGMEQVELALGGIIRSSGTIAVNQRPVTVSSPPQARAAGLAVIPEDRRKQALFPNLSVAENVALPVLGRLSRFGLIDSKRKTGYARAVMDQLNVNPRDPAKSVKFFSGGNQQKAVIGKWLHARAEVYVFVEPTAGVDVGAIQEIYDVIIKMAEDGAAVIVISSSIKEILSLCDRVLVIRNGGVVWDAAKSDCDYDQLLTISMGGDALHSVSEAWASG